jgi:hypothetical protein
MVDSKPTDEMLLAWYLALCGEFGDFIALSRAADSDDPVEAAQLYQKTISGG